MKEKENFTTISVRLNTKKKLEQEKIIPDETWDSLLKRLLKREHKKVGRTYK